MQAMVLSMAAAGLRSHPPLRVLAGMGRRRFCWPGLSGLAALAMLGGLCSATVQAQPQAAAAVAALAASAAPMSAPAAATLETGWPPLPTSAAVAARFSAPPVRYAVPALAPGRATPTSQAELSEWLAKTVAMARPPTRIRLRRPGTSQLGVPIEALHFSRGPDRPLALLIGQQHGNEPAGAEALLVLARELAEGPLGEVLDKLDVLLLPRANPDGALFDRRLSATKLDINRDHLLLRSPESRAIAWLARPQRPVLVVDSHEYTAVGHYAAKFDALPRADLQFQPATDPNLPAVIDEAAMAWFITPLQAGLELAGLHSDWYHTNAPDPADLRIRMGSWQPDVARNVFGLRHAVSLLVESRGIGLGPWHLGRRVHSQVVALRLVLHQAAQHAQALQALQAQADAQVAAAACHGQLVLQAAATHQQRSLILLDPDTGADKPLQVAWESALQLQPLRSRARPCGYWLASDQDLAVYTLRALGVVVQRLHTDTLLRTQAWVTADDGPDAQPVVVSELRSAALQAPAGSHYVAMDQPLANLAAAALEPDTAYSFYSNSLIDRLDAARRVVAPLARGVAGAGLSR